MNRRPWTRQNRAQPRFPSSCSVTAPALEARAPCPHSGEGHVCPPQGFEGLSQHAERTAPRGDGQALFPLCPARPSLARSKQGLHQSNRVSLSTTHARHLPALEVLGSSSWWVMGEGGLEKLLENAREAGSTLGQGTRPGRQLWN